MTNNQLKLAIPLSALLLLSSCRIENDLVQQQHEEMKIEKFKIFAERKPVTSEDYVKTFGELLLRYDSINRKDYAGRKELGKVKSVRKITKAEETEVAHIEFALGSPIIIKEGGKWMVFPKVKGKQVESLVIAYVNGEETKVGYRNMDKTTDFYNEYAKYFQEGYDKLLKAREELRKKKQASRYWEDLEDWEKREIKEKLIEEIILRGYIDWESYIRDKLFIRFRNFGDYNFWDGCNFSSGMEEFCEIFGDCKNTGGSSGGSESRTDALDFKMDPEDASKYPVFNSTVKNIKSYVQTNSKVKETLMKYTKFSEQELLDKLKYGKGPKIEIRDFRDKHQYGRHNPFTNTVEISKYYVERLEKAKGVDVDAMNLFLSITLLHEFVHWSDGLFFDYTKENGNRWEKETYGFVVGVDDVYELVKK